MFEETKGLIRIRISKKS